MKKNFAAIIIALIAVLGVFLGIFIYDKTNIRQYVENRRNKKLENDVVASVAGKNITETEARVYLAAMRSKVEGIYGGEIWDYTVDDEGTKYSELMKKSVLDKLIYVKLVCANAKEYGVELDADDRIDIQGYTDNFFAGISQETAEEYMLTEEIVKKIFEENVLAAKVYDKITLNYDVDANEDNCRQARFVIAKIDKFTVDSDGNKTYYSEEELTAVKNTALGVRQSMRTGNAYQAAKASGSLEEPRVTCGTEDLPEDVREAAFALTDGALSEVLESKDAFYIFYCEEDNDADATANAIQDKITKDRNSYFNTLYALWSESASIEIDEDKWDEID